MSAIRPRRMRNSLSIRNMVRETRISAKSLILPLFIKEGNNITEPIGSLVGHFYYSPDTVKTGIEKALADNIKSVLLFGIPKEKDDQGSGAYSENGVIQQAVRNIKMMYPEINIITDVCMCEYTANGHCGIVKNGKVANDITLPYLAKIALSHVKAGADMVAPSDMMDKRVAAIRKMLDDNGFCETAIMSYTAKYASAFYGPFRDVAKSAPSFGDRKTYQMDYHNRREAVREALLDIEEGADILMVKPAMSYLDIIRELKNNTQSPICAYSVSGEYAMIKSAAQMGYIDEYAAMCESAVSVFRAGADMLISYYARELAKAIERGDIG
jgi:porphobilinogen synthase